MKKILFFVFIFVILLVSACSGSQNNAAAQPAEEAEVETPAPEASTPTDEPNESGAEPEQEPTAEPTEEPTKAPEPSPTPKENTEGTEQEESAEGSNRVSDIDGMEMIYIPAGDVIMGSRDKEAKITIEGGRAYPEVPVNMVSLGAFWMDKYEITNGQYQDCVAAGVCEAPYQEISYTRNHYYGNSEYDDYPVIWVTWEMARNYCEEYVDRRLPTEAEWERAARGDQELKYPWGNEPVTGERANLCDINCPKGWANPLFDDGYADTAPVGSHSAGASLFGVQDMAGNVWEWTGTLIMDYPYDPEDGRENLDVSGERAWRGGAWNDGYWWMRASMRYRSVPVYWNFNLGFRCAVSD